MTPKDIHTDKIIRQKLEGFEKTPPAFVWSNIQDSMAQTRRRARIIYLRIAGVAAALAIAFMTGWYLNQQIPEQNNEMVVQAHTNYKAEANNKINSNSTQPVTSDPTHENTSRTIIEPFIPNQLETKTSETKTNQDANNDESVNVIKSLKVFLTPGNRNHDKLAQRKNNRDIISLEEQAIINNNSQMIASNKAGERSMDWRVGASFSPNYSVTQASQSAEYAKIMARSDASDNFNIAGGLSVEIKTKKRWSIQSGVYYNKLEQLSNNSNSQQASFIAGYESYNSLFNTPVYANKGNMTMNSVAGVIQIDNLPSNVRVEGVFDREQLGKNVLVTNADFNQNFEYIEVPVFFKYLLVDTKVDVQLMGGLSTNILVGNSVYMLSGDQKTKVGRTTGMNNFNYSGVLGFGLNYSLTPRLLLNIEPRFKYYFNSLNERQDIEYRPTTFGVYTGVSYDF